MPFAPSKTIPVSLGIIIPTYKRVDAFVHLLESLAAQISELNSGTQQSIMLCVLENPSAETLTKRAAFKSLDFGSVNCKWVENEHNIGGDANIEKAYCILTHTQYVWVIGDDERLLPGCLRNVMVCILANPSVGLFLLRDNLYSLNPYLARIGMWENYAQFARHASMFQPHLLLAHTLISSNIIKHGIYNVQLSQQQRLVISRRANLPVSFSHIHGFVGALSELDKLPVFLLEVPVLDTSKRLPPSDLALSKDVLHRLYRHHLFWISSEFGLDYDQLKTHESLSFIYRISFMARLKVALKRVLKPT